MKKLNLILSCLIVASLITSCKQDDDEIQKNDSVSDAVKTYFGYLKTTSGVSSNSNAKEKSSKIAYTEPVGESPDFFTNIFRMIDPDSSGSIRTEGYLNNGDYVTTIDYSDTYQLCTYVKWTSREDDRKPIYYYYYLKGKMSMISYAAERNKFGSTMNIQVKYPNIGKEYTIEGQTDIYDSGLLSENENDSYSVTYMKIKIGEIGKEIEFTTNQKSKYGDMNGHKATIVEEGTSQHARGKNVYNTLVTKALFMNQDSKNIISGTAKITYTKDGKTGEFSLDYGDGTDDTKATITENGKNYEIDYVALQDEMFKSLNN